MGRLVCCTLWKVFAHSKPRRMIEKVYPNAGDARVVVGGLLGRSRDDVGEDGQGTWRPVTENRDSIWLMEFLCRDDVWGSRMR
ncbi:uncharacterized protein K460DRAFT_20946 [Cucurbitaria berberidis CBS 394.84]|uniref:Uncharacterized protein n=1 Tax=Cucurbitaria berberidis CBS 394.84 TaxID=1168544 RepID=A0A9P4LE37_9PLEO|nr:uncharacterized protein K460DRAFT_20946 [Cucurbitaria berberidis CBS 394.84]KAF1850729.1 hypothetical protein K460DRAFT_20946 [Cucurbitaria berberidis CBS 394.84]